MLSTKLYNQTGEEAGTVKLPVEFFGIKEFSHELVGQVIKALEANSFRATAHSKDRSERRGGGKKPWRQKGTGRARHGSSRSPIWRKGGITFGPRNERNYTVKINKKMKDISLKQVLSAKLRDKEVLVIEDLNFPKTKSAALLLKRLEIKSALIAGVDSGFKRSFRNIPKIRLTTVGNIDALKLLKAKYFILDKTALEFFSPDDKPKTKV